MLRARCISSSTSMMLSKRVTSFSSFHGSIKTFAALLCIRNHGVSTDMRTKKSIRVILAPSNSTAKTALEFGCAKRFPTVPSFVSESGNPTTFTDSEIRTNTVYLPPTSLIPSSRGRNFIKGCCLSQCTVGLTSVSLRTSTRAIHVRDKANKGGQAGDHPEEKHGTEESEEKNKGDTKGARHRRQAKNRTFGDHIRGLKEDYMKFPDIYNSANAINFIIFTVFCLCSTGSNTEEKWWMDRWGLDNTFHPSAWLLHSFLCQNFLLMTFAMMLLHTMCHAMLPTIGSRGLLIYISTTAAISGLIVWIGNRLYYGSQKTAPEKQFGPWDVLSAMFVMEYLHYGATPIAILNSFNSWIRYAVWVGEICILYFDWQTTIVGAAVGLSLCKGIPRFRVAKVTGA